MHTRDQKLAAAVYERVTAFKQQGGDAQKYGSMAHKLPVLIRTAGLAQALAFVEARNDVHQLQLISDLAAAIQQPALVVRSRQAQLGEYMLLTREALAALLWFKRFAQSVLKIDDATSGEE
ncbi:type III-B CRISPR module-associated protein Cmr5 [Candidatus Viridilinea mediisalina]|uniref:CRISPR type III-B/RAMP module-associated protein Cmr5 n=1 Tax=Candidatus Viridilinea mediisalina TaxID=2024553 RepID=A0A2A6RP12_9CHLR|nr:type III-B CRISPR module-associated protein Cmr5 [Candidatus Viridilinea mediisalina]PDW04675.1 hypothetical protein CJ255_02545 [Candidatus Viridilinea mediisalina]